MPLSRLNFSATALRSAGVPATSVYFVSPASIARIAASLMLRGVSKSGSPCDRLITFLPSAIMRRATVEMAMVRLGWMRSRRSAVRDIGAGSRVTKQRRTLLAVGAGDQPAGAAWDGAAGRMARAEGEIDRGVGWITDRHGRGADVAGHWRSWLDALGEEAFHARHI